MAEQPIAGTVYFWAPGATLLGSTTFSLAAKAALVLNTSTVPGVAGLAGTIVAHDGGYGNLAAKTVALEAATGFSFDSPGMYKPQSRATPRGAVAPAIWTTDAGVR